MILGIAIGIVLIVAFARHETVRSKRRSDLVYPHSFDFNRFLSIPFHNNNSMIFLSRF